MLCMRAWHCLALPLGHKQVAPRPGCSAQSRHLGAQWAVSPAALECKLWRGGQDGQLIDCLVFVGNSALQTAMPVAQCAGTCKTWLHNSYVCTTPNHTQPPHPPSSAVSTATLACWRLSEYDWASVVPRHPFLGQCLTTT